MGRRGYREKRLKLWEENPCCSYCGVITVLPNTGRLLPNSATIEHVYPRLHPLRNKPNITNETRLILACYRCNNEKSLRDQADYLTKGEMRLRSMGEENWKGWCESWLRDFARFDIF